MDTVNLVGLVLVGLLGSVAFGISLAITFQSWRRLRDAKPRSDRMSVGK